MCDILDFQNAEMLSISDDVSVSEVLLKVAGGLKTILDSDILSVPSIASSILLGPYFIKTSFVHEIDSFIRSKGRVLEQRVIQKMRNRLSLSDVEFLRDEILNGWEFWEKELDYRGALIPVRKKNKKRL